MTPNYRKVNQNQLAMGHTWDLKPYFPMWGYKWLVGTKIIVIVAIFSKNNVVIFCIAFPVALAKSISPPQLICSRSLHYGAVCSARKTFFGIGLVLLFHCQQQSCSKWLLQSSVSHFVTFLIFEITQSWFNSPCESRLNRALPKATLSLNRPNCCNKGWNTVSTHQRYVKWY